MNVDYATLESDLLTGLFRENLEEELTLGFRILHQGGERLPVASHYAAQIAEIVNRGAEAGSLHPDLQFNLYQEILSAVEAARALVLGEPVEPM
ncbi:MAG TPA: hypothetical protein VN605_08725 [Thermoanaerobaculia bacterium]|nr:hypothetical protein [Thermoanaerobaculia bacterium]